MFWTGCEVADLNQGQKTIKMNHRNKIRSLLSPTDDPGDARDCMCESGPLYLESGHICHKSANFSKYGFSLQPTLDYITLVLLKPPKSMPASKYGKQRENGKEITKKLKKMVKNEKKTFLRKPAIFQPLMRGTAKQHGFLHIGANLVTKRALGQMGQIHPISTCI